jgi:type I restriction enzyme S subunit
MKSEKIPIPQSNSLEDEEMPEGWSEVPLSKILLTLESGSRPKGGVRGIETGIPSVGGEHLNDSGGFRFENIKYIPMPFFEKMRRGRIQTGDILIVKDGATTAKVSLIRSDFPYNPAMVNEHVFICRFIEGIYSPFVFYFLFSQVGQNRILENFQGSAQGGINQTFAENTNVPIAPFTEQQRIVARVETLLSHVNTARDRLSRVPLIMKKFRQGVLAAACSGGLTEGWGEENLEAENADQLIKRIDFDRQLIWKQANKKSPNKSKKQYPKPQAVDIDDLPPLPDSWLWVTLDQIVQENRPIVYGILKPGPDTLGGILYVRVNEMEDGKNIDISKLRRTSKEIAAKYSRASLNNGDVLISKDGTIGRVALVPPELAGGNITQHTVRASIHPLLNRFFFVRAIQSPFSQRWLENEKKGVALQGVNVEDFRRLPLPLPPLAEQYEIVRRVNVLFE